MYIISISHVLLLLKDIKESKFHTTEYSGDARHITHKTIRVLQSHVKIEGVSSFLQQVLHQLGGLSCQISTKENNETLNYTFHG